MFSPSQHQLRSREAPLLISHNGYRVVKVSDHFVVKYGRADQVDLLEELNVQQATKVKVPRVYALYNEPESSTNYVVKEYIKEGILMNYATSSHQGTLEVLGNAIFCMVYSGPHSLHLPSMVPSTSEAALNEAPALKYLATADTRTHIRGHNPTDANSNTNQYEVTLIDWELAGWFPGYWEYSVEMELIFLHNAQRGRPAESQLLQLVALAWHLDISVADFDPKMISDALEAATNCGTGWVMLKVRRASGEVSPAIDNDYRRHGKKEYDAEIDALLQVLQKTSMEHRSQDGHAE
ncbi:hypothetical protein BDDG_12702 [Blastomyces dermatitidis ATCC 18188]|uniref:Phosphotransferase enzyme family protein n=1 Tax=Ajellomyces dermatitidis (strain ATCC 18188 / CBS 674.68) TaxID=653446 RepID=A0A0J9ESX2_AJEDA|nr:hypothetical protein BDDG_12702 [Blastomyces dermatitidis ATCC 18188]